MEIIFRQFSSRSDTRAGNRPTRFPKLFQQNRFENSNKIFFDMKKKNVCVNFITALNSNNPFCTVTTTKFAFTFVQPIRNKAPRKDLHNYILIPRHILS